MSKQYEFRTIENKLLGSAYGYTPDEAANAYFTNHGVKPEKIEEMPDGTFEVTADGKKFIMKFIRDIN